MPSPGGQSPGWPATSAGGTGTRCGQGVASRRPPRATTRRPGGRATRGRRRSRRGLHPGRRAVGQRLSTGCHTTPSVQDLCVVVRHAPPTSRDHLDTFRSLNRSEYPKTTTDDERLQSRKPQVIDAIHEQRRQRSENPWVLGSTPRRHRRYPAPSPSADQDQAVARPCEAAGPRQPTTTNRWCCRCSRARTARYGWSARTHDTPTTSDHGQAPKERSTTTRALRVIRRYSSTTWPGSLSADRPSALATAVNSRPDVGS